MNNKHFNIKVDEEKIKKLFDKYGKDLTEKTMKVVDRYTLKVTNEAKEIIDDFGYRDTGRLINAIKPSLRAYKDKYVGRVNAGTKYAKVIHDGAKHVNGDIQKFFVPFAKAPSLFKWAVRNNVIYKIDGIYRLASTGQIVEPDKGGLQVQIVPAKYFDKPFNKYKDQFVKDMMELI